MFLLHLDDIDNCLCHSSIIKYADDTVIYVSGIDSESIQKKLYKDILEVHNWLTDNDISLNLKKGETETMIFGTSVLKRLSHSTYRSKGPALAKYHRINVWELTLTNTAIEWEFQFKIQKAQFQITIAVKTTPKSECKSLKNDLH